jgi:hypothetical protein
MKEFKIKIDDDSWTIRFVTMRELGGKKWGDCDHENRIIRIYKNLKSFDRMDTLIHEVRHAQAPHETEDHINRTSTEIAVALESAGYLLIN